MRRTATRTSLATTTATSLATTRATSLATTGFAATTAVVLAAAACGGPVEPAPSGDDRSPQAASFEVAGDLRLSVGETKAVPGTSVRVTFVSVTGDSRCPVDVDCVWEGNLRALLDLEAPGTGPAVRVGLNTRLDPDTVSFAGLAFTIAAVLPLPYEGRAIEPDAYRIALEVTEVGGGG